MTIPSRYRVREIDSSKDLMKFIKLPWKIYHNDPQWTPPEISRQRNFLDRSCNPFLKGHAKTCFFLLERGREVIGRIVAIDNFRHRKLYEDGAGFFGFFECIEDCEAAERLLGVAKDWLIKRGLKKMIGPTNFSSNDECGILIEGFDSLPSLGVPYTHAAYARFFEHFGLTKIKDLLVWTVDLSRPLPERMQRISSRIEVRGVLRLRRANLNAYERERALLKDVLLSAPVQGWGELPWTEEEYHARADELRYLVIPDLFLVVEHGDNPVAFAISVPDYGPILNQVSSQFGFINFISWMRFKKLSRMINRFRMFSLQIHRDYQRRGIESLLYMHTMRTAKGLGYRDAVVMVPEDYPITRQIKELGGKVEKRLRIYGT